MTTASRKLGELLVDQRLLSRDDLEYLLPREDESGIPIAKLLVDEGYVREEDLLRTVAERVGMEYVEIDDELLDPEAVKRLEASDARALVAMPVRFVDNALMIAVADPFDPDRHARLEKLAGSKVKLALATRDGIGRSIDFVHGPEEIPVLRRPGDGGAPAVETEEKESELHVNTLLSYLLEVEGSDLHLAAGSPPQVRVHGQLRQLEEYDKMMPADLRRLLYGILTAKQREKLEETLELDASHPVPGKGRFRLNVFFQRDSIGAVFRAIPEQILGLNNLGIPPVVGEFADMPRGLVLVTGPTGSGKSTTLAAIIDMINTRRACHILTVEDPIEFLHHHKRSIVNQREVGADTMGFQHALRHALRQDPDVILVGELRDLETISTALTAAETGHLVFATLHTQDAPQTIDRIIDVFPSHQQEQVRVQLAATLQAVVTQQLVPTHNRDGRVPAVEVMIATPAVRNLIREAKIHQVTTAMQAGGRYGMQTMDQSLAALVKRHEVAFETAAELCANIEDLQRLVGRVA
jgi:twitching motility protein PilT